MMGKLIGCVAVSVLLAAIYVAGGIITAQYYGYGDAIRASDVGWLLLFLLMASFMFGSIFITIGAACSDLKDAQGMMTPAMLIMMFPWMTWFAILNAPDSAMSVGLSLFPTNAPFLMLLRIMLPPGPPVWQIVALCGPGWRDLGGGGVRRGQDFPHRAADAGQGGDVRGNVEVGQGVSGIRKFGDLGIRKS